MWTVLHGADILHLYDLLHSSSMYLNVLAHKENIFFHTIERYVWNKLVLKLALYIPCVARVMFNIHRKYYWSISANKRYDPYLPHTCYVQIHSRTNQGSGEWGMHGGKKINYFFCIKIQYDSRWLICRDCHENCLFLFLMKTSFLF